MKNINVGQDLVAIVDDEDFERISQFDWIARKIEGKVYAVKMLYLHRVIMNAPAGMVVDHINGDSLDNRRSNLRLCTPAENARNRSKKKNSTSGFKGVSWNNMANKWQAQIMANGKLKALGVFVEKEDAARAYDKAARELHGEFARTNFKLEA